MIKSEESEAVSRQQFNEVAEDLSLTVDELSKVLGLTRRNSRESTKTLKLTPDKAKRFLKLRQIMAQAVKLHSGKIRAARWMRFPVPALRGRTPLECAATLDGLHEVEVMMTHFSEVVYSGRPRAL